MQKRRVEQLEREAAAAGEGDGPDVQVWWPEDDTPERLQASRLARAWYKLRGRPLPSRVVVNWDEPKEQS